ncbi:MAG TPA: sulfotransferase [Gammaproteobacteria bacterium]|nr:sulfotransferase [Gammaproteobacteria bacterium]
MDTSTLKSARVALTLPNFLIVGASRCGTTWMAKNLRLHQEIFMPSIKELHFFDKDFGKGWEYYASFFPKEKCWHCKAIGEATPAYLYRPEVPKLIRSGIPDVKIIVSLRNPIDRAYSHYWNLVAAAPEGHINRKLTFEEKLEFTPRLIDEGFYDERLSNYYQFFPKENILVVLFEEIIEDPVRYFREICKFLGIDTKFMPPLGSVRINSASSKLGRSKILDFSYKAFYKLIRIPALSKRIDSMNAKQLPKMNPTTRENLRHKYAPRVANLERLLNRDLSIWNQ